MDVITEINFGRIVDCDVFIEQQRDGQWRVISQDINDRGERSNVRAILSDNMNRKDAAYFALVISNPCVMALHVCGKLKPK